VPGGRLTFFFCFCSSLALLGYSTAGRSTSIYSTLTLASWVVVSNRKEKSSSLMIVVFWHYLNWYHRNYFQREKNDSRSSALPYPSAWRLGFASLLWRRRQRYHVVLGQGGRINLSPRQREGFIFLFLGFKFGGAPLRWWCQPLLLQ
jgi:hypothetical protein